MAEMNYDNLTTRIMLASFALVAAAGIVSIVCDIK